MRSWFVLLPFLALCGGCASRTAIIGRDIQLGDQPIRVDMESPWPFDSSALQLCIEPTEIYRPEPRDRAFRSTAGDLVRPYLILKSTSSQDLVVYLSTIYVGRNLACFSVHHDMSEIYHDVEIVADHPLQVDRAYWYWYFFH